MKACVKLSAFFLASLLVACGGDKDNSEPPAALTKIDAERPLALNWIANTKAASNSATYRLRPLLVDDRIFSIDTAGIITSINALDGSRNWRFETGLAAITGLGGNDIYLIASSADGDIIAYLRTDSGLEQLWKTSLGSEIRATPVIDDEQVFIRSVDGKLRALRIADGIQQWVVSRRVPILSLTGTSEPVVDGGLVFAGFDDGKLVAFDRDNGQSRWQTTITIPTGRTEVERLVDIDGDFVIRDGVVYVASFQGRLAAVQAVSGDLLWTREFSNFQSIAIDDDALYLSAEGSDIWAIDRRTGTAFWKQDVLHARKITAPSILDDQLVVADLAGYQHWFDKADGKLIGRIRVSDVRSYVQPLTWQASLLTLDKLGSLASVSLE